MKLVIRNLQVHFYNDANIINGLNLDIDSDTLILMNSDGGKSLILRAICGLVKSSGEVLIDGKPLNVKDNIVSLVLDKPVLLENKSVLKNIIFTQNVLKKDKKYINYDDILLKFEFLANKNKKVRELTLFQKRVLCLIRAYIKQPKILFLDDIFLNLNPDEISKLKSYLGYFSNVCKVYTSSSVREFSDLCVNIYYVKYGRECDMSERDLFLATNFGSMTKTTLDDVLSRFLPHVSDSEKDRVRDSVLYVDNVYYEKNDGLLYIYDGQTGDCVFKYNIN